LYLSSSPCPVVPTKIRYRGHRIDNKEKSSESISMARNNNQRKSRDKKDPEPQTGDMSKPQDQHSEEASSMMTNGNVPPAAVAAYKKKLTGATMNMKFMRRKTEQRNLEQKHHKKQASPSPKKEVAKDNPTQIEEEDTTFQAAQSPLVASYPQHSMEENSLVDPIPATTSDMYGISVEVVGRRSFGGFNRAMEDMWKASLRAHKEGGTAADPVKRKEKVQTDDELLAKYANLVKQRNTSSNHNNGGRPIGNLGDKVKPRKGVNNPKGSGEKRKRN